MPRRPGPHPDPRLQARQVSRALTRLYPEATCALRFRDAYELLVATILSAQCTDVRVNLVTPALFARFPDPASLATAGTDELEALIRSAGFFRAKSRNLIAAAKGIVELHGGTVPGDLDALTALAGVGRKTAHVVLGNAFGIASGVVVDTHVGRLSNRLGLSEATDPVKIERDLSSALPKSDWIDISHRLIDHGRKVCGALRPLCRECPLSAICPKRGVAPKFTSAGSTDPGES